MTKHPGGEVLSGAIAQIELGMIRAARIGPDDVLVIQVPEALDDNQWERLREQVEALTERQVVIVGPEITFGVLNISPANKGANLADDLDRALREAELILATAASQIDRVFSWASAEIDRLKGQQAARAEGGSDVS